jgi:hypothetical protein
MVVLSPINEVRSSLERNLDLHSIASYHSCRENGARFALEIGRVT